jgi:hypothetical protein
MTLVGIAVLAVEGMRAEGGEGARRETRAGVLLRRIALPGGFMLGLATFQAEFDFGVPQFRFVFQPVLIAIAAGVGLVATRMWLGRGAAIWAALFFLLIRAFLTVMVGPVLGQAMPYFPLFLVEAALVELVGLRYTRKQPLRFGIYSGLLIGTVGLATEWGWSHLWMPLPWPTELLPEAALFGLPAAVAGALVGAWIGARLSGEEVPRSRSLRLGGMAAATVIAALVTFLLYKPPELGIGAQVALTEAQGGPARAVNGTLAFQPPSATDGAEWVMVTAWQGGGLVLDRLQPVAPGVLRTTQPIPVHGNWKAILRLHRGNSVMALPLFLPGDPAIPAPEVPAAPAFTRSFVADHTILQREQKMSGTVLPIAAYGTVVAIALALLILIAWALHRLAVNAPGQPPQASPREQEERGWAGGRAAPATG